MHDLVDATRGETRRVGDLALGDFHLCGPPDPKVPALGQVLSFSV
jgi:hypothetical protein